MNSKNLSDRLFLIAKAGLAEANTGNPFWTKSDAMKSINMARKLTQKF